MAKFRGHGTFHIRTCQNCFHEQSDTVPKIMNDEWLERACKKCKSPELDFGSEKVYINGEEKEYVED